MRKGQKNPTPNKGGRVKGCKNPHVANYVKIARNEGNAQYICERIAEGKPIAEIAGHFDCCPSTIFLWVAQDPNFAAQFRLAKDAQADFFAEEVRQIADDGTNDWMKRQARDGSDYQTVNHEAVNRSKLRVETRLRLMQMFAPRRFGPKTEITHEVGSSFADMLAAARQRRIAAIEGPMLEGEAQHVVNAAVHTASLGEQND